jgi:hypothetical protein
LFNSWVQRYNFFIYTVCIWKKITLLF